MAQRKAIRETTSKRKPKRPLRIFNSMKDADEANILYWQSRPWPERMRELERLRQLKWGYTKEKPLRFVPILRIRKLGSNH